MDGIFGMDKTQKRRSDRRSWGRGCRRL